MKNLDHALALAARGLRVFPLHPADNLPAHKGWPDKATTGAEIIERFWSKRPDYGVGIATGGGVVGVDLDVKPDKAGNPRKGIAHWQLLQDIHDDESVTFGQTTTSGGQHHIYRLPDGMRAKNTVGDLAAGVDTRGERGYLRWHGGEVPDTPIAPAPEWLVEKLRAMGEPTDPKDRAATGAVAPGVTVDLPANLEIATRWLQHDAPQGQEGTMDDTAYRVAARVKDLGVSRAACEQLVLEHWLPRCEAARPPEDIAEVVENAYKSGQNPIGAALPEADFDEVAVETAEGDDDVNWPVPYADLMVGEYPRAEYVWDFGFLIRNQVGLLTGDGGLGKTTLDLMLGIAVAAGIPLFGYKTIQMPVLLVLCEDDYGETKHRIRNICGLFGLDPDTLPLHVWCRVGQDNTLAVIDDTGRWAAQPFYKQLLTVLRRLGPALCILDPASDLFVMDENKRMPVNAMSKKVLGGLIRETGATVGLTAHPSKASMADGTFYSGTTGWRNSVRSMAVLKAPDKGGPRRTLSLTKSQYRELRDITLWAQDGCLVEARPADQNLAAANERQAVLDTIKAMRDRGLTVVKTHGLGQKAADIADALVDSHGLSMTKADVLKHMAGLERDGYLEWRQGSGGKNKTPATFEVVTPDSVFPGRDDA